MKLKKIDLNAMMEAEQKKRKIWKLVLTGGPCGGKTTGQARLSTFFENLGWKVYRVPETATVLLGGGVNFADLPEYAQSEFQENLLRTMIQIENSFFALAEASERNCLVICDRGTMDASAFVSKQEWDEILQRNMCDEVDIRDNRYHQVVHMVTSAKGAEQYYTIEHHTTRLEGLEEARERDTKAAEAWIGHPYVDIIDNKMDFESKINRLISCVAAKMGIDIGDRLNVNAKKVKFAVTGPLPKDSAFPNFRDFEVVHHYLQTASRTMQSRLRKRGRQGKYSYIHTIRKQVTINYVLILCPDNLLLRWEVK
jgi:predicted ATPase